MECFYRSRRFDGNGKPIRGYRQRMMKEWRGRGIFEASQQRLCDQARAISTNKWLSDLEMESIQRKISSNSDYVNDNIENAQEPQIESEGLSEADDQAS